MLEFKELEEAKNLDFALELLEENPYEKYYYLFMHYFYRIIYNKNIFISFLKKNFNYYY